MKKLLFILTAVFFTGIASAQCTIDPVPSSPGLYPSNFPSTCVGTNYSETMTIVLPSDTVMFGFTLNFDSVQYVVSNVPAGLTSNCHNSDCRIIANPPSLLRGCIGINGVPTTPTGPTDSIIVTITAWVTVPFVGSQTTIQDVKIALNVFDQPDITVTTTSTTLTSNEAGATAYQWLDCDNGNAPIVGETSATFTPSASGNYAVEVTTGCADTSACTAFTATAGLATSSVSPFSIYPNPTTDQITIAFTQQSDEVSVTVYSASGQVVSNNSYTNVSKIETPITGEAGIYIIELTMNGETLRSKITKR
ncbi:MAG: T9SS type A sorting domain-containing protein [Flavobacteriia bacterium]|nr:T9SS type A sorting domain-containing protein [Flavobacteriia bacterium]